MAEGLRILILEDVPADAELVERELQNAELAFTSKWVDTREAFLKELEDFKPDLVLSDYSMPRFTGMEALELVQERSPNVPLIIVTGSMNEDTAVACMKAGAADYVIKDHLLRLGSAVEGALDKKRIREEKERMEQALWNAAREWRASFDAINDAVCLVDAAGRIQRCNKAFQKLIGRTFQEIVGCSCLDLMRDASWPVDQWPFVHVREMRRRGSATLVVDERRFCVVADPVLDDAGNVVGAVPIISDITERSRAEENLRFTNTMLATQQEAALDGILVVDGDGKIVSFNQRFIEMWGVSADIVASGSDERTIDSILDKVVDPEGFVVRVKHLYAHRDEKSREDIELADGRTFERFSAPMIGPNGEYYGRVWYFRDITERKQSEREIAKLAMFPAQNPNPVMRVAGNGVLLYSNEASAGLLGLWNSREGKTLLPEWVAVVSEALSAGEIQRREVECRDLVYALVFAPFIDADFVNIYGLDITERKQSEEALRNSELRLRTTLDAQANHVILQDLKLTILWANQAACESAGLPLEELVGRHCYEIWQDRTEVCPDCPVLAAIETGDAQSRIITSPTGKTWRVTGCPVRDERGSTVSAVEVTEDITEYVSLEAQLRHQQKLESIGTLAGGVAHEINNPVNGIMNYAQLILDETDPENPLREYADEIIQETERVATIVRSLLTFARQEKQAHSPARMIDIIEATLSLIRTVMRQDQIALEVDVPEGLPEVACRSQQIQQVLMNLMTNARDALNERYPAYDADKVLRITARAFEEEGTVWVRTTVEDHGAGIPPEVRARVFDPFFTTKPKGIGTGLGLSISHGIVQDHHGRLFVESEPGRTRFHLDLPLDSPEAETPDHGSDA